MSRIIAWYQVEPGMTIKLSHETRVTRLDEKNNGYVYDRYGDRHCLFVDEIELVFEPPTMTDRLLSIIANRDGLTEDEVVEKILSLTKSDRKAEDIVFKE